MDDSKFPAKVYAETVLSPNFEDAKRYFLDALIEIHHAHTHMLAGQGILSAAEEQTLRRALIHCHTLDGCLALLDELPARAA